MKKIITVIALIIVGGNPSVFAEGTQFVSDYSSISENDCKVVTRLPDYIKMQCPSHDGYAVSLDSSEGSAWLTIKKGKTKMQPDFDLASAQLSAPQSGPLYVGGEKLEWRYRIAGDQKTLVGLIYRIGGWDNLSMLHVVRISGSKYCQLGIVKTNDEARKIIDSDKMCPKN